MSAVRSFLPPDQRACGFDLIEPRQWPLDAGERREPVIDRNWGDRVVRLVGWRCCMNCSGWFFSPDVRRVRLHPYGCGQADSDLL